MFHGHESHDRQKGSKKNSKTNKCSWWFQHIWSIVLKMVSSSPQVSGVHFWNQNGLKPSPRFRTKSVHSYHSLNLNYFEAFLLVWCGCVHSRLPLTFHLSIGGNSQAPVVASRHLWLRTKISNSWRGDCHLGRRIKDELGAPEFSLKRDGFFFQGIFFIWSNHQFSGDVLVFPGISIYFGSRTQKWKRAQMLIKTLDLHPKRWKGPQKALRRSSSSPNSFSEAFAVLFPWILLGWCLEKNPFKYSP